MSKSNREREAGRLDDNDGVFTINGGAQGAMKKRERAVHATD